MKQRIESSSRRMKNAVQKSKNYPLSDLFKFICRKGNLAFTGYFIWLFCLSLTACDEKETPGFEEEKTELSIGVNEIQTKALDDAFETADKIGLYAVRWVDEDERETLVSTGNYADNVAFTLQDEEDNWRPEESIYYPAEGNKLDLFAYYPYQEPLFSNGTTLIPFQVQPDQSDYANYTASDLVTAHTYGVARTSQKVQLTFDHKLSQLQFALKAGEGFKAEELTIAQVKIKNAIIDANYDLSEGNEGIPVAGKERADVTPTGTWQISENDTSVLYGLKGIIVPQSIDTETYLEIKVGSRTFTKKFEDPIVMKSGESRLFTITIHNTELVISTTLNPWNYGDPVEGVAEENEEEELVIDEANAFITEWQVGNVIRFELGEGFNFDFIIDWGDGSKLERIVSKGGEEVRHTIEEYGKYEVRISGICEHFKVYSAAGIRKVIQWGNIQTKSWESSFSNSILTSIPPYMPDAENFEKTFHSCSQLSVIPDGLFDNCLSAKNFTHTFSYCKSLASIPAELFKNCTKAESFKETFLLCSKLSVIPSGLFDNCINAKDFTYTFANCKSLASIPAELFKNCTETVSFYATFLWCEKLTVLPYGLFKNCSKAEVFDYTFHNCEALLTISTGIFQGCVQAKSFNNTFYGCKSLSTIPSDLFSGCINAETFNETFSGCYYLSNLPSGIFKNCKQAKSFEYTFYGCNITSIPSGLFADCANVESFKSTFDYCTKITSIPSGLFDKCIKVETFEKTFAGCKTISSIPTALFKNNLQVTNFNKTFAGCSALTGYTPNTNGIELWMRSSEEYPQYPSEIDLSGCFGGCYNLTNYQDIPNELRIY